MNYGELKQAVIDDSHRPDLATFVPRFVTECEGLIRRQLTAYLLTTTLADADRISDGLYQLTARTLVLREIRLQGRQGDSIARVIPAAVRRLSASADVLQYAEVGDGTIEFRGTPGTDQVFDVSYYGSPVPLVADSDTNELLTDHESLYISGAKFFMYIHTQDRELAADELDIFNGVTDTLNEAVARKIGGANIAPSYNFAGGSSY